MKRQLGTVVAVGAFCMFLAAGAKGQCGLSTGPKLAVVLPESQLFHAQRAAERSSESHAEDNKDLSITGLWNVTFYSDSQVVDQGFDQWHSDGTEILNDNAPPEPPNGTGSVCLGVWKKTGPWTYKLRHPFWIIDANGLPAGSGVLLEQLTLGKSGDSYSGPFQELFYDVNGNPTGEAEGTIEAQRITVD